MVKYRQQQNRNLLSISTEPLNVHYITSGVTSDSAPNRSTLLTKGELRNYFTFLPSLLFISLTTAEIHRADPRFWVFIKRFCNVDCRLELELEMYSN